MSVGIADTNIVLHYFRREPAARQWLDSQAVQLSITMITWMELMEGSTSKASQQDMLHILRAFELLYHTASDQQWAMQQLEQFQFSHHIGKEDCLIAAVAQRLQLPLYTHNLKHMTPLIGSLAVKPYV